SRPRPLSFGARYAKLRHAARRALVRDSRCFAGNRSRRRGPWPHSVGGRRDDAGERNDSYRRGRRWARITRASRAGDSSRRLQLPDDPRSRRWVETGRDETDSAVARSAVTDRRPCALAKGKRAFGWTAEPWLSCPSRRQPAGGDLAALR